MTAHDQGHDQQRTDEASPLEEMARVLTSSGHYQVLRRFRPRRRYVLQAAGEVRRGLVLDVETTGKDARSDRIIEIACLPFTFERESGAVVDVGRAVTFLEDPGFPIPDEITALTGITSEMVAGQRIDDAAIEATLMAADIVIAHNAGFDCPFVERRFPAIPRRAWGCSYHEIPWKSHGNPAAAMGALLITHAREFLAEEGDARAHRAETDCAITLHCLATPLPDGTLPLALLLASARRKGRRLTAVNAPFDRKELLRDRGYRFHGGEDGRPKGWRIEVTAEHEAAERAWLAEQVYAGMQATPVVEAISAFTRYSTLPPSATSGVRAAQAVLPSGERGAGRANS